MKHLDTAKIIFLDQNKWIDLLDNKNGRYDTLLKLIKGSLRNKSAKFPISFNTIVECQKIKNSNRRNSLAILLAEVSEGWTYSNTHKLFDKEFEKSVLPKLGIKDKEVTITAVSLGIPFAVGIDEQDFYKVINVPKEIGPNVYNDLTKYENLILQIAGTSNEASLEYMSSISDLVEKRERLRSISMPYHISTRKNIYLAQLTNDRKDTIERILGRHGFVFNDFLDLGKSEIVKTYESVATLDVNINLSFVNNNNNNREISPNDLIDIDSLSVAIPYSDVVVCEKYMANIALQKKLNEKYNTVITTSLDELTEILVLSDHR